MFEIREDYLTGHKVLMSDERANRPILWKAAGKYVEDRRACPFCIENRYELSDITEISNSGRIIVLPNKYPALDISGGGVHEVIIDTDTHKEEFADFELSDMMLTLKTLFSRYEAILSGCNIEYMQIFKNDGAGSGASIAHSHWQVISIPFIPIKQTRIHNKFGSYYSENGKSYIEGLFDNKELIIYENEYAFAYMPYAATYGYSVNVAPIRHISNASLITDEETEGMAKALKASIKALQNELGRFPYNICFQQAPKGNYRTSHFYMELFPRIGGFGGMEIGTDTYINSFFPEIAASKIRKYIKA